MTKKICVSFGDSIAEALENYKTEYMCKNTSDAVQQIVSIALTEGGK